MYHILVIGIMSKLYPARAGKFGPRA